MPTYRNPLTKKQKLAQKIYDRANKRQPPCDGDKYPIYAGEMLTHLDPKRKGEFPDPKRFPPPVGHDGKCGCLMVTYSDARNGSVMLECIWQPWWDTVIIEHSIYDDKAVEIDFFQGNRLSRAVHNGLRSFSNRGETNLETNGAMSWPKRFHLWEFELQFSRNLRPALDASFFQIAKERMMFSFVIGEKRHFEMPVDSFFKRESRPNSFYAPLPLPLFIPAVQNFRARLEVPRSVYQQIAYERKKTFSEIDHNTGDVFYVRCVLHGYLSREIP